MNREEMIKRFKNRNMKESYEDFQKACGLHYCESKEGNISGGYGAAVEHCNEDHEDGYLWVGNGEYGTVVNYCPFCGFKAKVMPNE